MHDKEHVMTVPDLLRARQRTREALIESARNLRDEEVFQLVMQTGVIESTETCPYGVLSGDPEDAEGIAYPTASELPKSCRSPATVLKRLRRLRKAWRPLGVVISCKWRGGLGGNRLVISFRPVQKRKKIRTFGTKDVPAMVAAALVSRV